MARKKKVGVWSSSIQGECLTIDDLKNNISASLCLASYLAANWLQKLKMKRCVYYAEVISVLMCVFVVSPFDLYVTKRNYLCVTCQSLSHIHNTSLRCSNQPSWKLNLMMGVNTTKQQTGKIKNKKSNLVELNKVWKQPQRCCGKKDVLINNISEREVFSRNS